MGYIYDRFYKRTTGYYAAKLDAQKQKLRDYNATYTATLENMNSALLGNLGQANVNAITSGLKVKQSLALFRKHVSNAQEDTAKRMIDVRL